MRPDDNDDDDVVRDPYNLSPVYRTGYGSGKVTVLDQLWAL